MCTRPPCWWLQVRLVGAVHCPSHQSARGPAPSRCKPAESNRFYSGLVDALHPPLLLPRFRPPFRFSDSSPSAPKSCRELQTLPFNQTHLPPVSAFKRDTVQPLSATRPLAATVCPPCLPHHPRTDVPNALVSLSAPLGSMSMSMSIFLSRAVHARVRQRPTASGPVLDDSLRRHHLKLQIPESCLVHGQAAVSGGAGKGDAGCCADPRLQNPPRHQTGRLVSRACCATRTLPCASALALSTRGQFDLTSPLAFALRIRDRRWGWGWSRSAKAAVGLGGCLLPSATGPPPKIDLLLSSPPALLRVSGRWPTTCHPSTVRHRHFSPRPSHTQTNTHWPCTLLYRPCSCPQP